MRSASRIMTTPFPPRPGPGRRRGRPGRGRQCQVNLAYARLARRSAAASASPRCPRRPGHCQPGHGASRPFSSSIRSTSTSTRPAADGCISSRRSTAAAPNPGPAIAVTIILEDGRTYAQQGKLQFSDVTVDPTTGVSCCARSSPIPRELLPGMYVRAGSTKACCRTGILAPQQGIAQDPKGNATALVVNAQGKVEPRASK